MRERSIGGKRGRLAGGGSEGINTQGTVGSNVLPEEKNHSFCWERGGA